MGGNGRTCRFLMNVMLAGGGYPWLMMIPVERRNAYMSALEAASVAQDIMPFTMFVSDLYIKIRHVTLKTGTSNTVLCIGSYLSNSPSSSRWPCMRAQSVAVWPF